MTNSQIARLTVLVTLLAFLPSMAHAEPAAKTEPADNVPIKYVSAKQFVKTVSKSVWAKYPKFVGSDTAKCKSLNAEMQRHIKQANFYGDLCEWKLEKTHITPKAVSVKIETYRIGGAHRMYEFEPFNYVLSPAVRKMTFDDLFGQKVDYKKLSPIVRKAVIADIKTMGLGMSEHPEEYLAEDFPTAEDHRGFSFDEQGVTFWPNLRAEAMNPYNIKIPYKDLIVLIGPKSPVYAFAHKKGT